MAPCLPLRHEATHPHFPCRLGAVGTGPRSTAPTACVVMMQSAASQTSGGHRPLWESDNIFPSKNMHMPWKML